MFDPHRHQINEFVENVLFMRKAMEDKRLMEKYGFHVQLSLKNLFSDSMFYYS